MRQVECITGAPVVSARPVTGGGYSSSVWKVDTDLGSFACRLLEQGGATGGDVETQAIATEAASRLGIGPRLIGEFDGRAGSVSEWIEGGAGTDELFSQSRSALSSAVRVLGELHDSGLSLPRFSASALLGRYLGRLSSSDLRSFEGLPDLVERIAEYESMIVVSAPCHNDAMPKNWIWDGVRSWLLDFEFAGAFDPMWDLATLLAMSGFRSPRAVRELLAANAVHLDLWRIAQWMPCVWGLWSVYALYMASVLPDSEGELRQLSEMRWRRFRATLNSEI